MYTSAIGAEVLHGMVDIIDIVDKLILDAEGEQPPYSGYLGGGD